MNAATKLLLCTLLLAAASTGFAARASASASASAGGEGVYKSKIIVALNNHVLGPKKCASGDYLKVVEEIVEVYASVFASTTATVSTEGKGSKASASANASAERTAKAQIDIIVKAVAAAFIEVGGNSLTAEAKAKLRDQLTFLVDLSAESSSKADAKNGGSAEAFADVIVEAWAQVRIDALTGIFVTALPSDKSCKNGAIVDVFAEAETSDPKTGVDIASEVVVTTTGDANADANAAGEGSIDRLCRLDNGCFCRGGQMFRPGKDHCKGKCTC